MKNNEKTKRNYIIIGLCLVVLLMAVGYAICPYKLLLKNDSKSYTTRFNIDYVN